VALRRAYTVKDDDVIHVPRWLMMEIPLPSFETFTRVLGWFSEQAQVWLKIVSNPNSFLSEIDLSSPATFGSSVKFLFFVIATILIIQIPIDKLMWHINPFDATAEICDVVLILIAITIFSFAVYVFGKGLGGKGSAYSTLGSMFYATAFLPFLYLLHYIDRIDPAFREAILTGKIYDASVVSELNISRIVVVSLIQLPVIIYIFAKLAEIVKFLHRFGSFRAFLVVGLAGIAEQAYEYFIWLPLFAEIVKGLRP